jgi:hypothetical protein
MPDAVTESGAFMGPLTCASVPEKSTVSRSPVFETDSRIRNGASPPTSSSAMPSPSQKSSNIPSPSGRSMSAARISRSE